MYGLKKFSCRGSKKLVDGIPDGNQLMLCDALVKEEEGYFFLFFIF